MYDFLGEGLSPYVVHHLTSPTGSTQGQSFSHNTYPHQKKKAFLTYTSLHHLLHTHGMDFRRFFKNASSSSSSSSQMHNLMRDANNNPPNQQPTTEGRQEKELQESNFLQARDNLLQYFWAERITEINCINDPTNHQLPLSRIRKAMKSDDHVKMVSVDAPVVIAKACEFFILELSLRSWLYTESTKRQTLQRSDVTKAISNIQALGFLIDTVPKPYEEEDEVTGQQRGGWQSNAMQFQMLDFNRFNNYFSGEYLGECRRGALPRASDAVQISLTGSNHAQLNSSSNVGEFLVESTREAQPRPSEAVEISQTANHLRLNSSDFGECLRESRRRAPPRPSDAVEISLTGANQLQLNSYNPVPQGGEQNEELTVYRGSRFRPQSPSS